MMMENFGYIFKSKVVNYIYKIFTCKYSRNKNYFQVVGCSIADGYMIIGNNMDRDLPNFNLTLKSKYKHICYIVNHI